MEMDEFALLTIEDSKSDHVNNRKSAISRRLLNTKRLKLFLESLAQLLQGGIPMIKALSALEGVSFDAVMNNFINEIRLSIHGGMSLSEALRNTSKVPSYVFQAVFAGEASGSIPVVLSDISHYLDKEEQLKQKIREALTYPVFISLMGVITLGVLLRVVIPKLAGVYNDFGQELPAITRCILVASRFFLPTFIGLALFFAVGFGYLRKKKHLILGLMQKMPYWGKIFNTSTLIQFSRLISLLLTNGISILESLKIVAGTFEATIVQGDIRSLRKNLEEGLCLSDGLESIVWVDGFSKMMIKAGEESGNLPSAFTQISRDNEKLLDSKLQLFVKLLEPCLILAIGSIIGFIVIGTILPIFDISGVVQ